MYKSGRSAWCRNTELSDHVESQTTKEAPHGKYVLHRLIIDVHKKTISYRVKDTSGRIHAEGKIPARRFDLNQWMKTLPQPWMVAMEATIFTGWISGCATFTAAACGRR